MHELYLGLGSNLGDRLYYLQKAVDLIDEHIGMVNKVSSVYETKALGFEGEDFLNCVLMVKSYFNASETLKIINSIENKLGRIRTNEEGYKSRTIDIDILFYDDKIIMTDNLTVPHPRINDRKFVLIPLEEITDNFSHPFTKQNISSLIKQCPDQSVPVKINETLTIPFHISDQYNYIAIEGNIGAGKTSLTNLLSEQYNAKKVLERFADNAFLPKFYDDQDRYALPLEMSFLADRYQQLSDDLAQFDLFKSFIISDYYIFKSLIFAQVTLPRDEYILYRRIFDIMYKEITKPDLYIYLYQNTERLLQNIKKRGRDYEQNITAEYLESIHKGYSKFIHLDSNLDVLIIDVSEMDFVNNPEDYQKILKAISSHIPKKIEVN